MDVAPKKQIVTPTSFKFENVTLGIHVELVEINTGFVLLKIYYTIDEMTIAEEQYKALAKGQVLSFENDVMTKLVSI